MKTLDLRDCHALYHDDPRWCRLAGVDFPADCHLARYCPVARRGSWVVAVRDGRVHLIRPTPVDQFDGVNMTQALRLDVVYDDTVEFVDP